MRAAVLGAGSWGTTFAKVLADAGGDVTLWARRPELVAAVAERHENPDYLPGVALPDGAHGDRRPGRGARRRRDRGARGAVADAAGEPGRLGGGRSTPDATLVSLMKGDRARHRASG